MVTSLDSSLRIAHDLHFQHLPLLSSYSRATDGHGYYGWVIATGTQIIWRGKGNSADEPHEVVQRVRHKYPNSDLSPDDDVQATKIKEGEELPWEATLNIEADKLANAARDETARQEDDFFQYPASWVMLYIEGEPIMQNIGVFKRNK
eukprot:scaffold12969_cov65-Attheya_sp.AAC.7